MNEWSEASTSSEWFWFIGYEGSYWLVSHWDGMNDQAVTVVGQRTTMSTFHPYLCLTVSLVVICRHKVFVGKKEKFPLTHFCLTTIWVTSSNGLEECHDSKNFLVFLSLVTVIRWECWLQMLKVGRDWLSKTARPQLTNRKGCPMTLVHYLFE